MTSAFSKSHLKRYRDMAWLLWKYGNSDLVKQIGFEQHLDREVATASTDAKGTPHQLAADLERLGPTYVKLGQLLSTQGRLLPTPYIEALGRLQDHVEPFEFEQVERIVEEELQTSITSAFASFEKQPVAAASLGQVHRAMLPSGREVAVKVQRPGVRKQVLEDLDAMQHVARLLDHQLHTGHDLRELIEEARRMILRELDYQQEANNLTAIGEALRDFDALVVPEPVPDYVTPRVLTMDYVDGRNIATLGPLAQLEVDGKRLAEQLFNAYLHQVLVEGVFHADPHPGNVLLTEDGHLVLLALGMVGRITPRAQQHLLHLMLTISDGRGEETASQLVDMGRADESFEPQPFIRAVAAMVAEHKDVSVQRVQVGRLLLDLVRRCRDSGLHLPQYMAMIGKVLLNLEQVGHMLDSQFHPNEAIRRQAISLMRRQVLQAASPTHVMERLFQFRQLGEEFPQRLSRVMEILSENRLRLRIDAMDEDRLIRGMQKIANRITLGLILASLTVGAALLMQVDTAFTLFGYPGLAIILFLAAAIGGVMLIFGILFHDPRD